jgi:hypothetical protein
MKAFFHGADVSLTHTGCVTIDEDGKVVLVAWISDKPESVSLPSWHPLVTREYDVRHVTYLLEGKPGSDENQCLRLLELQGLYSELARELLSGFGMSRDHYMVMEQFAFGQPARAHQVGEAAGLFKVAALQEGFKLRLNGPGLVKKFATGDGRADKDAMRQAAAAAGFAPGGWGPMTPPPKPVKPGKKEPKPAKPKFVPSEVTLEDLSDAFWLAHSGRTEWMLRTGRLALRDLPEHRVELFNSVSKTNPDNILVRPWAEAPRA